MPSEKRFQAVFYRNSDGEEPVADYLASQPARAQVVLDNQIERLNELTAAKPHLPHPWSSQVRGELRELRCRVGSGRPRIMYARSQDLIVLLHAVVKREGKLSEEDIVIAQARWRDFKERMAQATRKPPRPAGHDAPRRTRQKP
jgi:phage-related protein